MLITIFGTPSALTYWIVHVARNLVEALFGDHFYVVVASIQDLRTAWAERNGRAVVFHSDSPQADLVDLFLQTDVPYLVISDAPMDVVGYATLTWGLSVREALRLTSQSLSILSRLRHNPRALYINQALYAANADDFVERLAAHFGLTLSSDEVARIHARLPGASGRSKVVDMVLSEFPQARAPGAYEQVFSAQEQSIINDTIESYGTLMEAGTGQMIVWRPEVVPDRDNLERLLDGPRDMVGPARIMFGGHTLHLPTGNWTASVTLEVAENYSGNRLLSQVYVGSDLQRQVSARLPAKGVLQYDMEFYVKDSVFPVQVLICLTEGAIEGQLLLRSVVFRHGNTAV